MLLRVRSPKIIGPAWILWIQLLLLLVSPAFADPPTAPIKKKILIISAEQGGIFASGGLGHATHGLAKALNQEGHEADVLMPYYTEINADAAERVKPANLHFDVGLDYDSKGTPRKSTQFTVHSHSNDHVRTWLFRHETEDVRKNYFYNPKNVSAMSYGPYGPGDKLVESFGAMSKAAAQFAKDRGYTHVIFNDWPGGIGVPFFLDLAEDGGTRPHLIGAVHNMAYQQQDLAAKGRYLGINKKYLKEGAMLETVAGKDALGNATKVELINPMRGIVSLTDATYTVARTHAQELTLPRFGEGLDSVVRKRTEQGRMMGIPNGIDEEAWNPARQYHPVIKHTFTPEDMSGKKKMKFEVQRRFGLPRDPKVPLFALTSRLADQKGFGDPALGKDYVVQALDKLLERNNVQVVITGDGEEKMATRLFELQSKYPYKFRYLPFNSEREKILTAGADAFVNFSRYEPSGLNQFFSLKNGTIPIVSRTGGLADSVKEGVNGFVGEVPFLPDGKTVDSPAAAQSALETMERFVKLYEENPWKVAAMRKAGMRESNSWQSRMPEFESLFDYLEKDGPAKIQAGPPLSVKAGFLPSDLERIAFPPAKGCPAMFGSILKEVTP